MLYHCFIRCDFYSGVTSIVADRSPVEGQSHHLQLGPARIVDQPDGGMALQDVLDYPLLGRDGWRVGPGHAQDHLREVRTHVTGHNSLVPVSPELL